MADALSTNAGQWVMVHADIKVRIDLNPAYRARFGDGRVDDVRDVAALAAALQAAQAKIVR